MKRRKNTREGGREELDKESYEVRGSIRNNRQERKKY